MYMKIQIEQLIFKHKHSQCGLIMLKNRRRAIKINLDTRDFEKNYNYDYDLLIDTLKLNSYLLKEFLEGEYNKVLQYKDQDEIGNVNLSVRCCANEYIDLYIGIFICNHDNATIYEIHKNMYITNRCTYLKTLQKIDIFDEIWLNHILVQYL